MEDFPEEAEIDGKLYKINTDYRYALACFKVINDEEISDIERAIAVVSILFGQEDQEGNIINIPENLNVALEKAGKFLCCGKETKQKNTITKKDMDFDHDKDYIYASFMSDYNLDITNLDMHFWKFCSLISGLTEDSILNRVRDLRNTNINDYKDSKTREKLRLAMENVALPTHLSKEEKKAEDEFNSLFGDD